MSYSSQGLGDASELGYAAGIYLQSKDAQENIIANLIIEKPKVAPKKSRQTIPKLELSAAHLVCDLFNHVAEGYQRSLKIDSKYAWLDSSIVSA